MWIADGWKDYEVLDTSKGEKLERVGDYLLVRPGSAGDLGYKRVNLGWRRKKRTLSIEAVRAAANGSFFDLPQQWSIRYKELTFHLKPFSFKHTGLFPEQAVNWDWFGKLIREAGRPVKVLNLFAYTGGATLAAPLQERGTHVDASKEGWSTGQRKTRWLPA